jgi:hypothetical protein
MTIHVVAEVVSQHRGMHVGSSGACQHFSTSAWDPWRCGWRRWRSWRNHGYEHHRYHDHHGHQHRHHHRHEHEHDRNDDRYDDGEAGEADGSLDRDRHNHGRVGRNFPYHCH